MFFEIDPTDLPRDASYYFDVCMIDIAVRESLNGEFEDIWDMSGLTCARPYIYHIYKEDDDFFRKGEKFTVMVVHHTVVAIRGNDVFTYPTESTTYDPLGEDYDYNDDEYGDLLEMGGPNDFWRF